MGSDRRRRAGKSGRVKAYRTSVQYTYDTAGGARLERALAERLPDYKPIDGCGIDIVDQKPVQICKRGSEYSIIVGVWE